MSDAAGGGDAVEAQRHRLGKRLRALRIEVGLTQTGLAGNIASANSTISDLENGKGRNAPDRGLFERYVSACLAESEAGKAVKQERWASLLGDYKVLQLLLEHAQDHGGGLADPAPGHLDGRCPYPGLHSFTEDTAEWFFGRGTQIQELVRLLNKRIGGGPPLFLIGASGAGKSSLLNAGLAPLLRLGRLSADDSAPAAVVRLTPGAHPLEALRAQLERSKGRTSGRWVLIVDQFEETFTQCTDSDERQAFVAALVEQASGDRSRRPVPVVVAVRADFFHRCIAVPGLAGLVNKGNIVLGPMTEPDLRQAITGPARAAQLELEPGLVEMLLRDLGVRGGGYDAGALPLLAHALQATWAQGDGRRMTLAGYHASGGIQNAVANTAQGVYDSLDRDEKQAARRMLLRLVAVDDGGEAVRRRVCEDELAHEGGPARVALQRLIEERLVTADDGVVQITHEALVRAWAQLREWLAEDRDWLRVHRALTVAAEAWQALQRDPGSLYRGHRLAQATEMAAGRRADLNPLEREFLEDSVAAAQAEIRRAEAEAAATGRRNERLRRLTAALALLVVASLVATAVAVWQWQAAEGQRRTADRKSRIAAASSLAAQSRAVLGTQPDLANLLALAGLRQAAIAPTHASAQAALSTPVHPARPLVGHTGEVIAVTFSPDGHTVATGSKDGTARLWAGGSHRVATTLPGRSGEVTAVSFSPDGKLLAAGSADGTARLWDIRTGRTAAILRGHSRGVYAVSFSPDGRSLATGSADATARLWDTRTGRTTATLAGHTGKVSAVAFSPDGGRLLTGSWDDTAQLWDLGTRRAVGTLTGHTGEVYGVAFSPDGKSLATGSADGTVRLWDTSTRRGIATLRGHTRVVSAVAFSPDGGMLLTGSWDDTARLWDLGTRRAVGTLTGHTGEVNGVAFSPDGKSLATGSADGTARLWGTRTRQATTTLTGHSGYLDAVAFSPDGRMLATGSRDGTARLWDLRTHRTTATIGGRAGYVLAVAFSPDGHTLATGNKDGTARLWDTRTHQLIAALRGHSGAVAGVSFSPDGRTLASASTDGTARLWGTRTRRLIATLRGHSGWVSAVSFSPDGRTLASASTDGTARLWGTRTHQLIATFNSRTGYMSAVVFSPNGKTLATAPTDGTAQLWDVATHRAIATLTGHTNEVTAVAFSPDGNTIATSSRDGTARLWASSSGDPIATLTGHTGWVAAAVFSPDGKTLATASWDRTARLTPVPGVWAHELCRGAGRNLTHDEWNFYVGDDRYQRLCPNFPSG
ncbi:helix-turn-helix domain-containing protein [Streptomyces sp. NBC_01142]|uniref:nSTAND1 domain-containing NTPase n=1 Tax=Streptomyces sp. NBC_01142 TaxID=2975865 RepID=UPI002253385C|nr:helix-turn-helix domain-containing protein [Streptomyces sp. NBC_01142]MCX4820962.1 helix-turn-helix domain-containing protein [Streptomyces sp. NBC_01142]